MATAKYQVDRRRPDADRAQRRRRSYYTDGEVWILRLVEDCQRQTGPVDVIPSPPATELKDQIWHAIAAYVARNRRRGTLKFRPLNCIHALSQAQRKEQQTMTVRAGREFLAIPGPTTMPDEVLQAMHRPALDIYSERDDRSDRQPASAISSKLFATKGKSYIYIANGHGAWEAVLSNVLSRGDKVLVLESGRFAIGWGNAARLMGAEVEVLKGDWRRAVRPDEVEARLRADKEHTIKAILVAQVDTASGVCQRHRGDRQGDQGRAAIRRCTWSIPWLRSAACRSRWTNGASTSRCPARRRA